MRPINELFIQIGPFTHFDNLLNEVFPSCGISVFIAVQQNVQKLKLTLKAGLRPQSVKTGHKTVSPWRHGSLLLQHVHTSKQFNVFYRLRLQQRWKDAQFKRAEVKTGITRNTELKVKVQFNEEITKDKRMKKGPRFSAWINQFKLLFLHKSNLKAQRF